MATKAQLASRPNADYSWAAPNDDFRSGDKGQFSSTELATRIVNQFEVTNQKVPRRDRVQILLKMLQAANAPIKKTHLMYGAGINFYQLEKHLSFLLASGMVEEVSQDDETIAFRTTEKGRLFSELFA